MDTQTCGAPVIANNLIPLLLEKLAPEFKIEPGKVYVQMRGPRFETKAEIKIVQHWGDVLSWWILARDLLLVVLFALLVLKLRAGARSQSHR